MGQSDRFKINAPNVVHETIDGEVVIVHLKKGDYYSLVKVGADIWEGITRGISRGEILQETLQRYESSEEIIENAIDEFIRELEAEEIIQIDTVNESIALAPDATSPALTNNTEKISFELPTLDKYTDMEELLALDPIHEVEEVGWPKAKV